MILRGHFFYTIVPTTCSSGSASGLGMRHGYCDTPCCVVMLARFHYRRMLSVRSSSFALVPFSSFSFSFSTSTLRPKQMPSASGTTTTTTKTELNFNDVTDSFASKSTYEIVRALAVFKICSVPIIVKNSKTLLNISDRVLGSRLSNFIMKKTFFAHFCAGETATEILPVVRRLEASGVGAILDYAAEADVPAPRDRSGVVSARTFDYEGEAECDANATVCASCIDAAGRSVDGFSAIKLTALGKPELLEHLSNILMTTKRHFVAFHKEHSSTLSSSDHHEETFPKVYIENMITLATFKKGLAAINVELTDEQATKLFNKMDVDKSGTIDYVEWINFLDPRLLGGLNPQYRTQGLPTLNQEELDRMNAMITRLEKLAEQAARLKVRLMIDAEQTYFQPAIDHLVLHLQRKYNRERAIIYNTYQCYLTDTYSRLVLDMQRAEREQFYFAAKVVRGAYMIQESRRALDRSYDNPILASLESTHATYHACVEYMLRHISVCDIMVASHNESSVKFVTGLMRELSVPVRGGGVFFGQLLGMCDHVSFELGRAGYQVYKYVPYGPVHEVIPYLLRRAEENSNLLGSATKERKLLFRELIRRKAPIFLRFLKRTDK